jgi:translation elongation factor aEF-1 beta
MAKVVIRMRIMPKSPEVKLGDIATKIKSLVGEGNWISSEESPIAFGLSALIVTFLLDESKAEELEKIEEKIRAIKEVESVDTIDVRRTFA